MSDAVDKILERVPYSDGGFRRRMTAGAIFSASLCAVLYEFDKIDIGFAADITNNYTILIICFLIIYAVGGLIELISDISVSRFIAVITSRRLGFLPMKKKSFDLSVALSENAYKYFCTLPSPIKEGLEFPFGKYNNTVWNFFSSRGSSDEVNLSRKLCSRNYDVLVIVTAITFSIFALSLPWLYDTLIGRADKFNQAQSQQQYVEVAVEITLMVIGVLVSLFPLIFLTAYVASTKQALLSLIEYRALNYSLAPAVDHNKSMQPTAKASAD
ncbi:hypothetical protein [Teredinibacter turnerae]|uniref:hypothetical protein n=1 Tax=Teredinibacter turnerae TaxID=2426 RepID=UPI00036E495A|nr:hypothetical protein [Teredinibacter turnerae]